MNRDPSRSEQEAMMPVFVIKAKDNLALDAVAAYQGLCTRAGLREQATQVARAWAEIARWRELHPDLLKDPDHEHVPASASRSPEAVERDEAVAIVRDLLVVLGDHSGDFAGWLQWLRDLKDRAQALDATSEKEGA